MRFAGTLVYMNPTVGTIQFQRHRTTAWVTIPFSGLRRLTLTTPVPTGGQPAAEFALSVPAAAQACEYLLVSPEKGRRALTGRTIGYVEAREGLYLFTPLDSAFALADGTRQVQRVFVPRSAYSAVEFSPSAEDAPGVRGIADPTHLLLALEQQQRMSVAPLGHSLMKLRMVTRAQLEEALAKQRSCHGPIGEMLVAERVISRADLQKALAHKMGYPTVDLRRFPIDPTATKMFPLEAAIDSRAVPLMLDENRLILAVDRPSRAERLRHFQAVAKLTFVPVLAPLSLIMNLLTKMPRQDIRERLPLSLRFLPSTI